MPAPLNPSVEAFLLSNSTNPFVVRMRDVHRTRTLTPAQIAAIERIMVEQGWGLTRSPDTEDVWEQPDGDFDPEADQPADFNGCNQINNGQYYLVSENEDGFRDTYYYKIFTIRNTNNDGLRHKRVVSVLAPTEHDYVTLGYLTNSGKLKLWRRNRGLADETKVILCHALLAALLVPFEPPRLQQESHIDRTTEAGDVEHIRWAPMQYRCRYCMGNLSISSDQMTGHNRCATWRLNDPAWGVSLTPNANWDLDGSLPAAPRPQAHHGVMFEHSTLSELGSGWEQ